MPDLSVHLNTSQAVSYHSFIINICRSIGPIAGLILSIYHAPFTFLAQSMCYFIVVLLCIPLTFKTVGEANKANKGFSFTVVWEYFKNNMQASRIFITSLIIMATGFSYTTLVPVLVHDLFPGRSEIFGVSMTFCQRWYDCNTFTTHNFEKVHHCTNVLFKFLSIWISACRCHYT